MRTTLWIAIVAYVLALGALAPAATAPEGAQLSIVSNTTWWGLTVEFTTPAGLTWTDGAQAGNGTLDVPLSTLYWTGAYCYEPDAGAYTYGVYLLAEGFSASPGDDLTLSLPGGVTMDLKRIPSGSFQMGGYSGEQDSYGDEDPQHLVTIAYQFYMGKYEVTKAQWEAVMGTTPWSGQSYVLNDPDSPAVCVSWDDAQSFVTALNSHLASSGQGSYTVRLPSESEWEYSARAGTTTRFYWGDDPSYTQIGDYAWYDGNAWDANEEYAHVVGQKLPNAWGLYDMSGNVWEWCQDWYHDSYSGAPSDGSAWESPTGSDRVLRGGGWDDLARYCRSALRFRNYPDYWYYGLGFRVVCVSGGL